MFSLRPLIVLHEKRIPFTDRYTDFGALERLPGAIEGRMEVQHNPELDGPVLVADGTPMTESFFIALYLDEAYPRHPLRPSDAHGRWRVLMWARFVNEVLEPAVSTLGAKTNLAAALSRRDRRDVEEQIEQLPTKEQRDGWTAALNTAYSEDLLEDSRRKIALGIKKIETALTDSEWLAGTGYSLADIDAYAIMSPVRDLAPDLLNDSPRTKGWLTRIDARPAVQAALATTRTGKPREAFTPGPEHSRWG
jgi:glutathione S-transferase/GST-like protein